MCFQETVLADKSFCLAVVDHLDDWQRARVMLMIQRTCCRHHVSVQEELHLFRSFPIWSEILSSRSCSMSLFTLAVVIGSANLPVKTTTLPFLASFPPAFASFQPEAIAFYGEAKLVPRNQVELLPQGTALFGLAHE